MPGIFERIRLNPRQLRTVAERRLADAECLRRSGDNERANGAIYLGGFVIELLLKARLLEEHPWLEAPLGPNPSPEEQRLWSLCYRSHDLDDLLQRLPRLMEEIERHDRATGQQHHIARKLMSLCAKWSIHARYSPKSITMHEASQFLLDVKEVRQWLK